MNTSSWCLILRSRNSLLCYQESFYAFIKMECSNKISPLETHITNKLQFLLGSAPKYRHMSSSGKSLNLFVCVFNPDRLIHPNHCSQNAGQLMGSREGFQLPYPKGSSIFFYGFWNRNSVRILRTPPTHQSRQMTG